MSSRRRDILARPEDRLAFAAEALMGERAARRGLLGWAHKEVLRDDLPHILDALERGQNSLALELAANAIGVDPAELFGMLPPDRQTAAGLAGYLQGLAAGSEPVIEERPRRRRLYG